MSHGCRNLFGKIKEDKLTKILKEIWRNSYSNLSSYNESLLLRLLLIERKLDFFEYIILDNTHFKGYILLDIEKLKFDNEYTIILDDELDYINEAYEFSYSLPVIFKVTEIPRVHISEMGLGEGLLMGDLADLGGRNHTHSTYLNIKSGNVELTMYSHYTFMHKRIWLFNCI
ncbi:hypothetical protein [Serpentinicella alkaliphila]|uniref:Uncharacterized protein n=1 Tax=Serpentinicella alkaliphila TaxID=1734049 RepID=A0A4V2T4M6_9FIRM|nr:hypothetical protein [Serpentinicella alkaliphila]QUH26266.1 hypothetical protein HZR23_11365 [Serpentinicella alkaliphila]TCQ05844.1 hypothetical protein EDD79_100425 [Serpentinicella alkaliphila]